MTIRFNTEDYVASHGKPPKGRGGWIFAVSNPRNTVNYLVGNIQVYGTYTEARKKAAAEAKARGIDELWVMS